MDAWTLWRGDADTRPKRWALWIGLAALLHAPLTPLVALIGLVSMLFGAPDPRDVPAAPPITAIPVDLLSDDEAAALAKPAPPEEPTAEPEPVAREPDAPPKPRHRERPDAGPVDAGAPVDAAVPEAGVATDAGPTDGGALAQAPDAGDAGRGKGISDPIGVSGVSRKLVNPGANVSVLIDTEKVRAHPLGARIGTLLSGVYQWRDFFGPTAIDPIRDIDRMLIAGPQLRDSSEVVVVLQHHLPRERMKRAIDALVQRDTSGAWLDAGVPIATARADRAERFFVLPAPNVVVVTPKSALDSAVRDARRGVNGLPGPIVAKVHVVTPWRAFINVPFRIPQSIRWARAEVSTLSTGGVVIDIEALDESVEIAAQHAPQLQDAARAATELNLGILGSFLGQQKQKFVESVNFSSQDSKIIGKIVLTDSQILTLIDLASVMLGPSRPRRVRDAGAGAPSRER